jgi:hypothetical protein
LRPFSVTQPTKATYPGFASSGSRCVFALTMCLDALLLRRPPWCLSTRLAPGVSPFSASLARDRLCLPTRPSPPVLGSKRHPSPRSEDLGLVSRHCRPVEPQRLHFRGLLPLTHESAAAGFLRWPRLPLHSWASSSLRLSPPVPRPWSHFPCPQSLSEESSCGFGKLNRQSLALVSSSEDDSSKVRS